MNNIRYRPEFNRDIGDIHGGYEIPTDTVVHDDAALDEIIVWTEEADSVDELIRNLYTLIDEQTSGMILPVSDPELAKSVNVISQGDHDNYINGADWMRAQGILSDGDILSISSRFDLVELLWAEIKIRVGEWIAGQVEKVPVVGKDLADKLRASVQEARDRGFKEALGVDSTTSPRSLTDLMDISGVQHAQRISTYIKDEMGKPQHLNFNPIAVEMKPVLDDMSTSWEATKRVINTSYGIQVTELDPGTTLTDWVRTEGSEALVPLSEGYSYIRGRILTTNIISEGVVRNKSILNGMHNTLRGYLTSADLACCLLDNILGLSRLTGNPLKFLKILRVSLRYGFNGLNVSISSLADVLIDIFNRVISAAMGKIIGTLEEYLTDTITGLRNTLSEYARGKGEAWVRCYPFDEMMNEVLRIMYKIEDDLLGYLGDFTNSLSLGYTKTTKYMIQLKGREFQRRGILVLDALIKGIETGIICKDLSEISIEYVPPTPEELRLFAEDSIYRDSINIDEARRRFMRAPSSGEPLTDADLQGKDLRWLQNCNKSMNEDELAAIARTIQGIGII